MRQSLVLSAKHLDISQGQVRRLSLYWKGEMKTRTTITMTQNLIDQTTMRRTKRLSLRYVYYG